MRTSMFAVLRVWLVSPILILMIPGILAANIIYVEDFEDDNIPGAANFASSIFLHGVVGPNWFFNVPFFGAPSPPHALFLGAQTNDFVTFNLNPGQTVQSAEISMTGTGGGWAGVTFVGTLGVLNFSTMLPQDTFQLFSVGPADGLGDIVSVVLGDVPPGTGPEALYDDLRITVVPEPSSFLLGVVIMGCNAMRRSKIKDRSLNIV